MEESALRELYWDKGLSTRQIGELYNRRGMTILYWMKKHKIPRRLSPDQSGPKNPNWKGGISYEYRKRVGLTQPKRIYPPEIKLDDFSRGLLVGLIEGEGNLTLSYRRSNPNRHYPQLTPMIEIWNTDEVMLRAMQRILGTGGVYSRIDSHTNSSNYISKRGNAIMHKFLVSSLRGVLATLKSVGGNFITERKKRLAKLLFEFCERRLEKNPRPGHHNPYDSRDFEIYDEMRALNQRGKGGKNS